MNADRTAIIEQLLALSRDLGREDRDLVILAEGNTSARLSPETFAVKGSGCNLASLDESGLVECRFAPLLQLLDGPLLADEQIDEVLFASRVDPSAKKPSVEAVFHAALLNLPGVDFIGHTHPTAVNGVLCSGYAQAFANHRRYPDEIVCCGDRSVLVPYVDPGVSLARSIALAVKQHMAAPAPPPRTILLQNHGLIALGSSPAAIMATTLMATKAAKVFLLAQSVGGATSLPPEQVHRIAFRPDEHYRQRQLSM